MKKILNHDFKSFKLRVDLVGVGVKNTLTIGTCNQLFTIIALILLKNIPVVNELFKSKTKHFKVL